MNAAIETLIAKIGRAPARARRLLPETLDAHSARFIAHNRSAWHGWAPAGSERTILVDYYTVSETVVAYSYFLNVLARKHRASIMTFGNGPRPRWTVLDRTYRSFNAREHVATHGAGGHYDEARRLYDALRPALRTKQDVMNLHVRGVWIGIDVYESYLRAWRGTAEVDDPALAHYVQDGIAEVLFWQHYFATREVSAVVVSHDCYIRPNIVCKVAYQAKVPVYLPNVRGLNYADRPHSIYDYFSEYRRMFARLPAESQAAGLALARAQLDRRFAGEVGVDMPYAEKSAFVAGATTERVIRESNRTKLLICSHCFYDNPHGFGGMVFVDFYEWLCYLGELTERTDYDWYLKVHPDPLPRTLETIGEIVKRYPRLTAVPYDTSHHQLAAEGIDYVLTCYGSVGHEYPALGVPVINCGYNPRVAYDFNIHASTLDEYERILLNLGPRPAIGSLDSLYEFYYMHHHYTLADDLILPSYLQALTDLTVDQRIGPPIYSYFLDRLTTRKHDQIIDTMSAFIESGKAHFFSRGPE